MGGKITILHFKRTFFLASVLWCLGLCNASAQQLQYYTSEGWNYPAGVWSSPSQTSYEYDESGHCIRLTFGGVNEVTAEFIVFHEETYTNDAEGHPILTTVRNWDDTANALSIEPSIRMTKTFNSAGNLLTELWEYYINGEWINNTLDSYEYDASGFLTSHLYQGWPTDQETLIDGYRWLYSNNPNGMILTVTGQTWQTSTGIWYEEYHVYNTYDDEGRLILESSEGRQVIDGPFEEVYRIHRTYDDAGHLIHKGDEGDYLDGLGWHNLSQSFYTYNPDGTLHQEIEQYLHGNDWRNANRYTYYYDTLATESFAADKDFSIYPNPAADYINIKGHGIKGTHYFLTDIGGQIISSGSIKSDIYSVDLSALAKGMYLLKAGGNVKKFIKN